MNKYSQYKTQFIVFIWFALSGGLLFSQLAEVDHLEFAGNQEISSGKLKNSIKTKANPWYYFFLFWKEPKLFKEDIFLNDLLRIEQYYHQEGYLDARIVDYTLKFNDEKDEVKIEVELDEGQPTVVDSVGFSSVDSNSIPLKRKELLKLITLKNGMRYCQENLSIDYNRIIEKFSNSGFPYVEAKVKPDINRQDNRVVLTWFINSGPFSKFGEIHISGNSSVSDKLIRGGIDFKEGQPFEQKKLAIAQSQIYQLELFQYVNLQTSGLENRPTEIPIRVQVKERDLRTLNFGAGYGTEESFRAKADWTNRNFLGGARILRTKIKHSTKLLPLNVELELSQPFFLDDQNDFIFRSFFTWQDEEGYEAWRLGFEAIFNRQLSTYNNLFITSRTERDSVQVKGDASSKELNNLYNKSVLAIGINHNSTNQLFTPSKGSMAKVIVEESGLLFNSRFEYYKVFTEYRFYHEIDNVNVLATRLFLGAMKTYGNSITTPIEERFFAGGSYSVRGWARQQLGPHISDQTTGQRKPIGGHSRLEGNLEMRYPIYKKFGGSLFLDFGNVWLEWDGFDLTDLKYSIGTGLNYNTPIGPIRIDFAWKLNKQVSSESNYQIHISIGQAF